jgi:PII-like signaling protein
MAETPETNLKLQSVPAKSLKVFITEEDRHDHHPLHRVILRLLHDAGIACATVFKGVEGFGERRLVHTTRNEIGSLNLPLTIEATGAPEKIDSVVPRIAALLNSGVLETSHTNVIQPAPEQRLASSERGEGGNGC